MKYLWLSLLLLFAPAMAQADDEYDAPHKPYNVVGNVYQVGTEGIGVYLITTPQGHILIDAATEKGAAVVEANIAALGFRLHDIKYIVDTHAHWDHVGGLAKLKRDTGATLIASEGDRYGLEHGIHVGDNDYGGGTFPAIKVDRVIGEGGTVALGGTVLTAHMTPGHTRGGTTWTTVVTHNGRKLTVLFFGSTTTAGNVLVGNSAYPGIADDYRATFKRLKTLRADVFLVNHPSMSDLDAKLKSRQSGVANAFIDPLEFPAFVAKSEKDFNAELAKQQKARP